jgi:hypothetical protein
MFYYSSRTHIGRASFFSERLRWVDLNRPYNLQEKFLRKLAQGGGTVAVLSELLEFLSKYEDASVDLVRIVHGGR